MDGPLKWFGATNWVGYLVKRYHHLLRLCKTKAAMSRNYFQTMFEKDEFFEQVMWEMNDGFWKNKLKVNWSLFYFTVFSLIWWSLDFFYQGVVITRDNVCFSLTTWLICVYISFADKKTIKFKGYQLDFCERLLTHYHYGSQITSTYLKCLSDRLWIFFPPMKMQRPHVFAVRAIGRQEKKMKK